MNQLLKLIHRSQHRLVFFAGMGLVLVVLLSKKNFLHQDQAMYLYAGRLLLAGKVPFVDFFDINPSFITYFSSAIIFLADKFRLNEIVAFKLAVYFIYLYHLLIITKILRFKEKVSIKKTVLGVGLLSLTLLTLIFNLFWGQRDELFAISFVTYLLLKYFRLEKNDDNFFPNHFKKFDLLFISVTVGFFALFKPHFMLIILSTEIISFCISRKRKILTFELLAILFTLLAGALHLLFLNPEAYFYFWNTHISSVYNYYSSFNLQYGDNFTFHLLIILPVLSITYLMWTMKSQYYFLSVLFMSQTLIAILVVFLQGRHFLYHYSIAYVIASFYLIVVLTRVGWAGLSSLQKRWIVVSVGALAFSCLYAGNIYFFDSSNRTAWSFASRVEKTLSEYVKKGDVVFGLSAVPRVTYPAVNNLQLVNGSRYLFQYPISFYGMLRFDLQSKQLTRRPSAVALQSEQKYFLEVKEDILRNKPKIIYYYDLPESRQNLPYEFSMKEYFKTVGLTDFLETKYDKVYKNIFTIYRIKPLSTSSKKIDHN